MVEFLVNFTRVPWHYDDVIMSAIASQITSLTIVYSIVYSDADQRKHQSSASLAFVRGIHRDRWIPRTNGQLRGKCFHLMTSSWVNSLTQCLWNNPENPQTLMNPINVGNILTQMQQNKDQLNGMLVLWCVMYICTTGKSWRVFQHVSTRNGCWLSVIHSQL